MEARSRYPTHYGCFTTSQARPLRQYLHDDRAIADYTLFWISCKDMQEANYLLAIINSKRLYATAVTPLMPKGQFGARHLHKHLWKLPIPEFDPATSNTLPSPRPARRRPRARPFNWSNSGSNGTRLR